MTLMAYYDNAVNAGTIIDDPMQRLILVSMQRLIDDIKKTGSTWFRFKNKSPRKGLYIHGPVGVGKTWLVDLFYQQVDERKKSRFHFHQFMQQSDSKLRRIQGKKNPLNYIAQDLAKSTRVLCLDEFLVHDVAYAMILAELFQAFMNSGIILVISSNTRPEDLYLNGIHRDRFLPAIEFIKRQCEVLYLDDKRDYRLGRKPLMETYLFPLTAENQKIMEQQFFDLGKDIEAFVHELKNGPNELRSDNPSSARRNPSPQAWGEGKKEGSSLRENGLITIQNRDIAYKKIGYKSIWFEFNQICNLPRSPLDYLEIAHQFDTIFISNIPRLTPKHSTQVLMFIHFIDIVYDQGIRLIISAESAVEELYLEGDMKNDFKRTLSRLMEMQSMDYRLRHTRRQIESL